MKLICIASILTLIGSCATPSHSEKIENLKQSIVFERPDLTTRYLQTITSEELRTHVYTLASKDFEGRKTGEKGFENASNFLKDYYMSNAFPSPFGGDNYYQTISESYFKKESPASQNVVAFIEGSDYPEEIIILSAHLDHLGSTNETIHYGADDNASGTAALMEVAQAFIRAKNEGHGPKRSILFLHLTAEEMGLLGSNFYVHQPIYPLHNTVANLNIDMIGRVDTIYKNLQKEDPYMYIIGADRLSTELHYISEAANQKFTKLHLDYRYNKEDDKNRYYYRSDHYNFASRGIPAIFYFNGEHEDYHKPSDTADKINYKLLQKRTQLIFATTWYLANSNNRLSKIKL